MELPGQQLYATHASSRLDYMLNLDIKRPPACQRLTGIFCVIGKSCSDIETLEKMISVGMNVAVINTTFGTRDENIEMIKMVREATKNYSEVMRKNCPVAVAINLAGRKIRTGHISDTYGTHVDLKEGEVVRLTSDETYKDRCSPYTLYVDFGGFVQQMKRGDRVLLDNERIELRVEVISTTTMTCRIERGGLLGSQKDVFIPNVVFDMPNFTDNDRLDIEMAVRQQVDIIVAPFVHNSSPVKELKSILGPKGKKIFIISEIKSLEGYRNFEEILEVSSGVIVCRQELGTDVQPKKLILAQKNLIARANKALFTPLLGHVLRQCCRLGAVKRYRHQRDDNNRNKRFNVVSYVRSVWFALTRVKSSLINSAVVRV
ncbi:Pyruvate kinase [Eumeta japonica]|uniref:Pyruvate kinase n=1 Tax=Eumeta variegata TaxID=151549 RepID=A0A4C1X031_EUMVA|nr:Pyruvate kinase [Eumeta japonica]